jgi:hypothetical protein
MIQKVFLKILIILFISGIISSSDNSFCQISIDTNLTRTKDKSRIIDSTKNIIQIDTTAKNTQIDTALNKGNNVLDSLNKVLSEKNILTNTKVFLFILLSLVGLVLFFFFFVMTLFKYFHKTKSSRQSMLLSWNLFMLFSLIWIFIIWGLLGSLWNNEFFSVIILFLFVVGLIMTIFSIKSK